MPESTVPRGLLDTSVVIDHDRIDGAHFATLLPVTNPFGDWSHHDRYAASRCFDSDRVEAHRVAALRVCEMVERATQDPRS